MTWQRINLADDEYDIPPQPPRWGGLLYERVRHVISGPPESVKTLLMYLLLLLAMREGATVGVADFEMGPKATRRLLTDLGFTLDEIGAVHYFEPETEPGQAEIAQLVADNVEIMLLDSLAGAFDISDLDDNKRKDVERWLGIWILPLWRAGIASIALDHVVKNAENRGSYSIGSERKLGGVDVHLGMEVKKPLGRGTSGLFKIHVHKDRPAYLRAGGVREVEIHSDPETHAITWSIRETSEAADGGSWQPTVLMGHVSQFLEAQAEPVSRNVVEKGVSGMAKYVRRALDELIRGGYVEQHAGSRNSLLVHSVRPYTATSSNSSHFVSTSSDEVGASDDLTSSTSSTPYRGDEDEDEVEACDVDTVAASLRLSDEVVSNPISEEEAERLAQRHQDLIEGSEA